MFMTIQYSILLLLTKETTSILKVFHLRWSEGGIPSERLLAQLQLFQQVRKKLVESIIAHTTLHHVGCLMGPGHDLDPRLVNVGESLGFLWCARFT